MNIFSKSLIFSLVFLVFTTWVSANPQQVTRGDAFIFLASQYQETVPESFQYIDLKYKNIDESSQIWDALQMLVYLDRISNSNSSVFPNKPIDLYSLEKLTIKITKKSISLPGDVSFKQSTLATQQDLITIQKLLGPKTEKQNTITISSWSNLANKVSSKQDLFEDVYKTLSESHYDHNDFTDEQLIDWAIKWLAEGTGDKYTSYFPPVESEDFFEWLDGEYEWIGAYIDMQEPWILLIVSPIVDSPAETAWIKWGDRVTHVDGREITPEDSQKEVISWIKGPKWSVVELTILREWETNPLIIPVTRAKIIIKDIEHKELNRSTYYIQIKNFWERVDMDFENALWVINASPNIQKIIIDLRNNPGGYLDEVSKLLGHIIPDGQTTAIVSNGKKDIPYISKWYGTLNISDYEIILLQNGGTASASEIMIWTIKDYFPEVTIIGEQSFGKWSVQSLKKYYDGSTLKYTSAKWYTGKTRKAIDGVGITPDLLLDFDSELYQDREIDNQLEKALEY